MSRGANGPFAIKYLMKVKAQVFDLYGIRAGYAGFVTTSIT